MKEYVKPVFESIELTCEERMAGSCKPPHSHPPHGGKGHGKDEDD